MTKADIARIFSEQKAAEANEAADAKRLSRVRRELKRGMDEIELGNEEEVHE
jgi:hypothetical protein